MPRRPAAPPRAAAPRTPAVEPYRDWQSRPVVVAGRELTLATKPGVFAHGAVDPGATLLAERTRIEPGEVVVQLHCGNGLFGAVAASVARQVVLADRHVLSVEAARRTLDANGVTNAEVLLAHGVHAARPTLVADVVAVRIPHEKVAQLQLLWDAFRMLRVGGRCYLAGATNEGGKTAARTLEALFGNVGVLAHDSGHRLVVAVKRSETPGDGDELRSPFLAPDVFHEFDATVRGEALRLSSRPGVFSWDHLDEATALLADEMRVAPGASVLDLGCGVGALGIVAARMGAGRVTMLDADVEATRAAARSAAAAGVTADVRTSDVASAVLGERFDVVVTNPPFHVGKATDLQVPQQFIADAWEVLAPGGQLYLVANRTLPYERAIQQRFGAVRTVHDGARFKVLVGQR